MTIGESRVVPLQLALKAIIRKNISTIAVKTLPRYAGSAMNSTFLG